MSPPTGLETSVRDALNRLFFSQATRLLRIETRVQTAMLMAERAVIHEAVNQPFEITVDCLSTDAHLPLQCAAPGISSARLQSPWVES